MPKHQCSVNITHSNAGLAAACLCRLHSQPNHKEEAPAIRTSPPPRMRGIASAWMSVGKLVSSESVLIVNNEPPVDLLNGLDDLRENAKL